MNFGFLHQKEKAKVIFKTSDKGISLIVRDGFKEDSPIIESTSNKCYFLKKGVYSYDVSGPDICSIHKVFTVSEEYLGRKLIIDIPVLRIEGKEAEFKGPIFLYSDELEEKLYGFHHLTETEDAVFDTPSFEKSKKMHQFATNKEKVEYIRNVIDNCDYGVMNEDYYSFPVVFFSKNKECLTGTSEQMLDKFQKSGKLNVFYHAQIHGNETASGEGALVILKKISESFGREILKKINIVIVPCVNLKGNTEQIREYGNIDLNRDFLKAETKIVQDLHKIFYNLSPEVVIDGHTFTRANSFQKDNIRKALFDIRLSSCNTLNMEPELINLGKELVDNTLEDCRNKGFRCGYYGTSVNANASRSYYALSPCCSILVETEGTRTAKFHFRRNVWAQCVAITILMKKICAKSDDIKKMVDEERKKVNHFEGMFRNEFVTEHGRSKRKKYVANVINYDFFGSILKKDDQIPFYIYDVAKKTIKMKKEYLIEEHKICKEKLQFLEEVHGINWNTRELENGKNVYVIPGNQPQIQVFLSLISTEIVSF